MADNDAATKKSGNEVVPKNGDMNKNKQGLKLENLKNEDNEHTATKATIIIPPDGGFAWVVMVINCI